MNSIKTKLPIALVVGMIFLVVLGFNLPVAHTHGHGGGHGGGGHGGGGHGGGGGGGHHHGGHPHAHYRGNAHQHPDGYDSHYRHRHDDIGDHDHPCRTISGNVADDVDRRDPSNEECLNHDGKWEPSWGD